MEEISEIRERLARLEEWQERDMELTKQMAVDMSAIRSELTKYKGMLGGVIFTVTAIASFIGMVKGWFTIHWMKGG